MVKKTIPNDIIEFVLKPSEAQPYTRGAGGQVSNLKPTQVWKGRGIILESDAPVIVYGMVRYQFTSDGFLALPINKCGNQYIISSYRETANFISQSLTPYASVIGISDSTTVTFHIGGNKSSTVRISSGEKYFPYDSVVVTLNKGDYWLIASEGNQSEIGGSFVDANKPVAVLSGTHCSYIPTGISACDYLIEQELPTNFWGEKYYVSNIADRKKSSIIRIFAMEPNTNILRNDSMEIGYITKKFGIENEGWIETRASTDTNRPAMISATKPINVMQYNQGLSDDNVPSDPFQMTVLPSSAFQKYFVFNTPGTKASYGFRKNYLNLIYKPTANKQIPDNIELGEVLASGEIKWTKVKNLSAGLGNPFTEKGTATLYNKILPLPYDAIYHIKSEEPIMAYLYGFSDWDSYGYPASGFFIDTTINDEIDPKIEPKSLASGDENPKTGTFLVTDKDDNGDDNLAFTFVDQKNTFNVDYQLIKDYNNYGKISSVRIDWEVINEYELAQITIHAIDNNGNTNSHVFKYVSNNPNKTYIVLLKIDTLYYLNNKLSMKWMNNLTETIKVSLLKDNIETKVIAETENTGKFEFTLSDLQFQMGKNYSIRVSGSNSTHIADTSNKFMILDSLKSIKINYPNNKALIFHQADNLNISWVTQPEKKPVTIDILDTLGNISVSFSNALKNVSPVIWEIPSYFQPGKYVVKISGYKSPQINTTSEEFEIKFNKDLNNIEFFSPTDTTIGIIGLDFPIRYKPNYLSNFEMWLYKNNSPLVKISDDVVGKNKIINKITYRIDSTLLPSNDYSIVMIDKLYSYNKLGDIRYQSPLFKLVEPNSVKNEKIIKLINHRIEQDRIVVYSGDNSIINSADVFDIGGKKLFGLSKIDESEFVIPRAVLIPGAILIKLKVQNQEMTYKFILID